ncbi:MAG: BTAD domain-containing putative transcriptional regulator, partial [Chloroflexota bacterium]
MLSIQTDTSVSSRIRISFLGNLTIEVDGQPLSRVPGQKIMALLAYLLCNPQAHTRVHLADLLWDDIPFKRFLPNLRATLNRVPKDIKPYLITTNQTVEFGSTSDIWVDVVAIEQLIAHITASQTGSHQKNWLSFASFADELAEICALYTGSFLAHLDVKDAPRFTQWKTAQQARILMLVVDGWRMLAEFALHQHRYSDSLDYAKRIINVKPDSEIGRKLLVESLLGNEQTDDAFAEYETLMSLLNEMGLSPSSATAKLAERLAFLESHEESASHLPDQSKLPQFIQPP